VQKYYLGRLSCEPIRSVQQWSQELRSATRLERASQAGRRYFDEIGEKCTWPSFHAPPLWIQTSVSKNRSSVILPPG
jgi:hypothetical protein